MKQFWETEVCVNDKGNVIYNDDCVVTITSFGEVKQYSNRDFQNITILGPNGTSVEGMSLSYAKTDAHITPDDMNKELPCRIKTEHDSGQYSYNGRKYTFMLGEKKQSSSGGYKGARGYEAPTTEEIRGKCRTLIICAAIQGNQLSCKTLVDVQSWTDECLNDSV